MFHDWATNIFRTLEKGAIYFGGEHSHIASVYLQHAMSKRKDLAHTVTREQFMSLLNNPVFVKYKFLYVDQEFQTTGMPFVVKGLMFQLNNALAKDALKFYPDEIYTFRAVKAGKYKEFYSEIMVKMYADMYERLGKQFLNNNNLPLAEQSFLRGIEIGSWGPEVFDIRNYMLGTTVPTSVNCYINLAEIWTKQGAVDKSVNLYNKIITLYPTYDLPEAYLNLALIYLNRGEGKKSVEIMENYCSKFQYNTAMLQNFGVIAEKLNVFGKAVDIYKTLISIEPNAVYYYLLSIVYWKQNDWVNVKTNLAKCLTLFPEGQTVIERNGFRISKPEIQSLLKQVSLKK